MKKRLSIILCIVMMLTFIPTTAFAKTVSISPKAMTLAVGDIAQLTAANTSGKLTWTSSDEDIATVTKKGIVQGKSSGTATITVKTSKKQKATCKVTVVKYAVDSKDPTSLFETIKDKITALIRELTYTKSEIDNKFAQIGTAGSSGSYEPDIPSSSNVPLYGNQVMTFTDGTNTYTITDVKVVKSKYDGIEAIYNSAFCKYKYTVKIEGTTNADHIFGDMRLTNKYGAESVFEFSNGGYLSNATINDGVFTVDAEKYSSINATEVYFSYIGISD